MAWSLFNAHIAEDVEKLFAGIDESNEGRAEFVNAMPRDQALAIVHGVLWLYGCRGGDFSAMYAMEALTRAVGRDLAAHFVALHDFGITPRSGGDEA